MSHAKKHRKRRTAMWNEDPHCRRCGVLTYLPEMLYKDVNKMSPCNKKRNEMATVGHKYNRLHRDRLIGGNYELLCQGCNVKEGARDIKALGLAKVRSLAGCCIVCGHANINHSKLSGRCCYCKNKCDEWPNNFEDSNVRSSLGHNDADRRADSAVGLSAPCY